jgi:hypothetical protein
LQLEEILVATALITGENLGCKSTCNCKKILVATLLAIAKNITVVTLLATEKKS